MRIYCVDELLSWSHATSPERALLAAILERAVRDLSETSEAHIRREAIQWFTANGNSKKYEPFTYKRIVEELDINSTWLKTIEDRVAKAEDTFYVKHK